MGCIIGTRVTHFLIRGQVLVIRPRLNKTAKAFNRAGRIYPQITQITRIYRAGRIFLLFCFLPFLLPAIASPARHRKASAKADGRSGEAGGEERDKKQPAFAGERLFSLLGLSVFPLYIYSCRPEVD